MRQLRVLASVKAGCILCGRRDRQISYANEGHMPTKNNRMTVTKWQAPGRSSSVGEHAVDPGGELNTAHRTLRHQPTRRMIRSELRPVPAATSDSVMMSLRMSAPIPSPANEG